MREWYETEADVEVDDELIKEYDITSTPNDFNIFTIFNLIDKGIIKMPPFQRNYVWDKKRASKLIESIILGLPIPQVFLYEKGKNNFLVIDGQQRLLSIYFFIKQRFPTSQGREVLRDILTGDEAIDQSVLSNDEYFTNFTLRLPSPLESEKNKFNKLKYETLGEVKHTFDYLRTIRSVVIKQSQPDDQDSAIYEIFNRLNTGGQNLTPQEIRMSLFYSDFYKMLIEINKMEKWRDILGNKMVDLHFKDVEILLRAFAMLVLQESYKPSMTRFLNGFSKTASSFGADKMKYLRDLFESFLESCENISSDDFYSSNRRFNISLFAAVFVATCIKPFQTKEFVSGKLNKQSLQNLKNDDEFVKASQDAVASKKSVTIRMNRAQCIIETC